MKKVITCVDQNAFLKPVRDYGIYVAKSLGAELVFIHVVEIPELGENFYGLAAGEEMLDLAREILGTQNASFICANAEVPADEIIKYRRANELDLIATGAFTKGFFKKLFLGSVSEDILHNALVPVLVLS